VFNGLAAFPEAGSAETDGPARIVSVGRLVEKKGFPELLAACALLRERGSHFHCDIIGAGPLEATLQTQIEESGLGDLVTLHGAQPQDVVRNFLSRARAFALAARQEGDGGSDNLPTVIMEAMAYGLPVVSTRIAGIPEMVDPGETGALVSARDVPSFAEALATYLRDRNLAREHGRSGQARCRQKFDVRRSAAELAVLLARHTTVIPPESATQHDSRLALSWWERFARRIRPRR
jgi:colanic acid/amylovoran biosynthesis glycosyltransferase